MDLTKYTTAEINKMRSALNLTEEEESVFNMLVKGKSIQHMAFEMNMSTRSIDNRIAKIRKKINRI